MPGNDPYVITVGAVDSNRTPGYWADDILPSWSATGPTLDGFAKPDVLAPGANIVSFMYNDQATRSTARPGWSRTTPTTPKPSSLFRMNGTSMATAVTSGVVALMLQAHPELTPDQVKFRLMYSARPALAEDDGSGLQRLPAGHGPHLGAGRRAGAICPPMARPTRAWTSRPTWPTAGLDRRQPRRPGAVG